MNQATIIMRRWSSRIRTSDEAARVAYIAAAGLEDYRAAGPPNRPGDPRAG